jgi:hypothetical protein
MVEQAVQAGDREVARVRDRDGERVEPQAERLGVEVAARVEALRLVVVRGEHQRAVGHGAQLAVDLGVDVVEQVERGAVDLREHAERDRRLRAVGPATVVERGELGVDALLARVALELADARGERAW